MKIIIFIIPMVLVVGIIAGLSYFQVQENTPPLLSVAPEIIPNKTKLLSASNINPEFLFSIEIPNEFMIEYLPQVKAINIYDPNITAENNLEKSQIYVSFFKANSFLTLRTVDITKQDAVTIVGHQAVVYEIAKKSTTPNFLHQPSWRNFKHEALDIRRNQENPTHFYSFAKNPTLSQKIFDDIIQSFLLQELPVPR